MGSITEMLISEVVEVRLGLRIRKERKDKKDKDRPSKLEAGKKKKGETDSDKDHPSKLEAGKKKDKDKKEDKDDKEDKDKRTDKQQKVAFDKGMQKGAAVVNNENLSNQAIKIELNQLELKYKLKELDAKLITEKEDLQTWMLSGKLDTHKGTKSIERKPTKAESEEDVSEEDRKLHVRIAAEVKAQLEAKGKSTEGVETFEEFYGLLQSEAVMLQKKYQPALRDGIKIAVDLVNSVKEDAKDGDVDVRVEIAPNATVMVTSFDFNSTENKKQKNQDFITGITSIIDDLHNIWAHKDTEFDGNEAAIKSVNAFFEELMKEVEEYQSVDMDGFNGITTKLDGDGRKRKIKINRDGTSIGNVKANYEVVPENKELTDEDLRAKVLAFLVKAKHIHPKNYSRAKHWRGNTEDERKDSSSDNGPGQFLYSINGSDAKNLEIEAIQKGRIVDKDQESYHFFYTFSKVIGYSNGKETKTIRAEITGAPNTPTIHSHPR
jgi:hypothetical protein